MAPVFSRFFQLTSGLWRARRIGNLSLVPRRTMYPSMSSNVIAGPPKRRISTFERLAVSVFFFACIFTTPVYILTHLDDYRTLNLAVTMGYVEPVEEVEEEPVEVAADEVTDEVADEEDGNIVVEEEEEGESEKVTQQDEDFCVQVIELKSPVDDEED